MKQFASVFRFEMAGYIKNKVFMGMTVAFVLIICGVLSWPRIQGVFSGASQSETPGGDISGTIIEEAESLLPTNGGELAVGGAPISDEALAVLQNAVPEYAFTRVALDGQALHDAVSAGEYAAALMIESGGGAAFITPSLSMYDTAAARLTAALQTAYRVQALGALDVPVEQMEGILAPPVTLEVVVLGESQMNSFWYTYILILLLFMTVMMYGQLVATAVATEKSSRTMELLITSARPNSLLFGKVLAAGLAGLMQMGSLLLASVVFYRLNASAWGANELVSAMFSIPPNVVAYMVIFFVLGYAIYAFMYGAVGSLASRLEDMNTTILPVMFIFMGAFMVTMFSMASGNVDNALMLFCSFFPLTSPMAMFARIAMGQPPLWQIAVSMALLIGATFGIGVLGARIYRIGVLMYGKPPKAAELIRMLRAEKAA